MLGPDPRKAFSLVELLVVVAIIVAMLALLMPAMGKAIEASHRAVCAANLRQMGQANLNYAADHFGRNVHERPSGFINWMPKLAPYLSGVTNLVEADRVAFINGLPNFRCPTASEPGDGPSPTYSYMGTATEAWQAAPTMSRAGLIGSYGLNMWTEDPAQVTVVASGPPEWFYTYLRQVRQPGNAPLFGDCVWDGGGWPGGNQDGHYPQPSTNPFAPPGLEAWTGGRFLSRFAIYRHGRGTNLTFADGHSQWISFAGLWGLKWHNGYTLRDGPPWMPTTP